MLLGGTDIVLRSIGWADARRRRAAARSQLLEETLGFDVAILDGTAGQSSYENVANGLVDGNVEVWLGNKDRSLACTSSCGASADGSSSANIGCALERPHDFLGHVGTYVSYQNNSLVQSHLVDFWRSFKNPETLQMVPGANFSAQLGLPRRTCSDQHCSPDGRHYPARCGGDGLGQGTVGDLVTALSHGCRAYFGMHENWDEQFEQAIDALGLPLVTTFVGDSTNQMREYLRVAHQTFEVVLFYHWKPSILLSSGGFLELNLPQDPQFCTKEWGSELCELVSKEVTRLVNPSLKQRLPAAASLLDSFRLNGSHVDVLLHKHPDNPASTHNTTDEAACEWLNEMTQLWRPWVEMAIEEGSRKQNVSIGLLFDIGLNAGDTDEEGLLTVAELAMTHVNEDSSLLLNIALQPFRVDLGRLRVLNSDHVNVRHTNFVADEAHAINDQFTASGAVAIVGASWSSDVKVLAPILEPPLVSPSATAEVL